MVFERFKNNFMKNLVVSITNSINSQSQNLRKTEKSVFLVINSKEKLVGTLTDGDIRRAMLRGANRIQKLENISKKNQLF